MDESRLPERGVLSSLPDSELLIAGHGDSVAYRLTIDNHVVGYERLDEMPGETVVLPEPDTGAAPVRADGSFLPPFDEFDALASAHYVQGATAQMLFALDNGPFRSRALEYTFEHAQLRRLRLLPDPAGPGVAIEPEPHHALTWRAPWTGWCAWRSGQISGEQLMSSAQVRGSWPMIALAQGLFEHDRFLAARALLPKPEPGLALLRLVDW